MKINEVEKLLGITKTNIRFYEKEGLLTPTRTENGYRDYSDADIARLKDIVIYRKLGIPVQQIEDILDGAVPLQEALDANIQSLQSQLDNLSGSIALCRQLKSEDARTLDTERYWDLIQEQEQLGFQFQSLVEDYLKFSELNYEMLLWPLPGSTLRSPLKVGTYILGFSALMAATTALQGGAFLPSFFRQIFSWLRTLALWTAVFTPIYLLSKKKQKLADGIMSFLLIAAPIAALALIAWALMKAFPA